MKKGLLIALPLLLILGGAATVGLDMAGMVNVPFLPFGKKRIKSPPDDGKGGPFASLLARASVAVRQAEAAASREAATAPPPPKAAPKPALDTGPGEAKLAGLWAAMPTDRVVAIAAKWPSDGLGRILAQMDEDAAAKLLAALPPARAADLSRALAKASDEKSAQIMKKDSQ